MSPLLPFLLLLSNHNPPPTPTRLSARRPSPGATSAAHNRHGHSLRRSNVRTSRPPRWEREGDRLYDGMKVKVNSTVTTISELKHYLAPWTIDPNSHPTTEERIESNEKQEEPPFLWGGIPVGPVMAQRLKLSGRFSPTSVQRSAFPVVTSKSNAIIASPTGTGKTLAYLLPLLCSSPGGSKKEGTGGVLIVTPTIELACQIRREVDVLWPNKEGGSRMFVVGDGMEEDTDIRVSLGKMGHSPVVGGTPKMLRMLYREAEFISSGRDSTVSKDERIVSHALVTNLRAIVLDEADRLLRTEAVAREAVERKRRKLAKSMAEDAGDTPQKEARLVLARQTQTELLLRDLPVDSLDKLQLICASATVGRTMRRQLMQLLGSSSADSAATLITGDDDARVGKNAELRRSVLLPDTLIHAYRIVDTPMTEVMDDPSMSLAERNEERMTRATISALWDAMSYSQPTLIFPGKIGVERIQQELLSRGREVRTLKSLRDPAINPVYVIGERFARGLDLPDVEVVFMLSPPSSAAGYAHMAGRTGRIGKGGRAVTFVRVRGNEGGRMAAIAETLGLKLVEDGAHEDDDQ